MTGLRTLSVLGLIVAAVAIGNRDGDLPPASGQVANDPNVVFVLADDLRPNEMDLVADVRPGGGFDWIRDHGVQFDNYISTDNLCCPGRMTALTGQTAYNHGVFTNHERDTPPANLQLKKALPLWMQKDNYCTGFTGKYHLYDPSTRPAGWTYWEPLVSNLADEYGYKLMRRDGTIWQPGDFITDRIALVTRRQIRDCLAGGQPAFVAFWPFAPHFGAEPHPDYANVSVPWSNDDPSFNEADLSDKPAWLQALYPQQRANANAYFTAWNNTRVRTLFSVDQALKSFINTLLVNGQLGNTLFVLTGDNGFLMGEHRVELRKSLAYEAAQTALWVARPGFPAGGTIDAFATNLDLAPTIVKATRRTIPLSSDGRHLQGVLSEGDLGHDRFLPIYVPGETAPDFKPVGDAVRTWRYKYVRYADGSEELYDLFADPYEEANRASDEDAATLKADMQALLEQAKTCARANCRASAPAALQQ